MNKLTTIALLLLSITFSTSQQQPETIQETIKTEEPKIDKEFTINDPLYNLHFQLEKTKDNKHNLLISMDLKNGSYYVSPNAKRDFSGKFYMDLGSYKDLDFKGELIETPRSVEEIDPHPFVGGAVNWVRVNTSYKQSLEVKSQEEFVVFGRVQFTIEPRCSFEEIPFAIRYKDGKMIFIDPKC